MDNILTNPDDFNFGRNTNLGKLVIIPYQRWGMITQQTETTYKIAKVLLMMTDMIGNYRTNHGYLKGSSHDNSMRMVQKRD
jgi:hypothetical protein